MELLETTIRKISPRDSAARKAARERISRLTMPPGALGKLCDLAVELAGITGRVPPPVARKMVVVMAGDHGVVDEGVSAAAREVTQQMVANFIAGGAGVNVLARLNGAEITVVDVGMAGRDEALVESGRLMDMNVAKGTRNMRLGPAMTRGQAVEAVEAGIEVARRLGGRVDVFGAGEMGIGNTTPATAIVSVFTGRPVSLVCGKGAGLRPEGVARKIAVIEEAIALNKPDPGDPLDVLSKVGGFEIAAIAGLILGAAAQRKPVLVDGFISTAGAMLAKSLCPLSADHFILAHASGEPGHSAMREWIGREPLLHLDMRLGEGSGAALAMNIVEAAVRILAEMATFGDAGVHEDDLA